MREVNSTKPIKFADQNQNPTRGGGGVNPVLKSTTNASKLKSASSWGSQIVKGFSAEKKTKTATTTTIPARRLPLSTATNRSNNTSLPPPAANQSRAKRSILGEFTCSAHPSQVYPADSSSSRPSSTKGSHDLFLELDHLRTLLKESKERELNLQSELSEHKKNPKVSHLEKELESKRIETDNLVKKVGVLETESKSLIEQLVSLSSIVENQLQASKKQENVNSKCNLEMEVVELRRLNKELQLQKRNLACRLSTAETRLAALENISESDVLAKVKAEASTLRDTNEDLCKQVEGLQMNRLTEVEELVYLRWVNSCLRSELQNSGSNGDSDNQNSAEEGDNVAVSGSSGKDLFEFSSGKKLHLMKKLKKWPKIGEDLSNFEFPHLTLDKDAGDGQEGGRSPRRRHSISGSKLFADEFVQNKRRQSDGFTTCAKETENEEELGGGRSPRFFENSLEINRMTVALDVEKRALRIPNPPPRPSCSISSSVVKECAKSMLMPPPPPPPPPPPKLLSMRSNTNAVQRVPQVVEFYHSLMKRESRKDSNGGGVCEAHDVSNARSSMIDEIENRSSHLLAIKADVETQGEFVNSLIREVNGAVYQDIEDVVAFVKWLDDELCFLVDERAVLKHFEWPEKKADTLREAAFGYRDLKKLESEVSSYEDDPRLPCDTALKKMVALSEKMERSVHSLSRTRDGLMRHCKDFQIPTDWMLDTGIISKIKFGSVKLAKKYMKRVAMELLTKRASEKDPALEYMLLQGVRFAFRIHQFAGGFDAETMHAFEELRNLAMSEIQK